MKKLCVLALLFAFFAQASYALDVDLPYEIVPSSARPSDGVAFTGREYLKRTSASPVFAIYRSADKIRWEKAWEYDLETVLEYTETGEETAKSSERARDGLALFAALSAAETGEQFRGAQILYTGKEYLVRATDGDLGYHRGYFYGELRVFDLNLNFVRKIPFDEYIMQMAYYDGAVYLAMEYSKHLLKSKDLVKWEVVAQHRGVPLPLKERTLWQFFDVEDADFDNLAAIPVLDYNGLPGTRVALELGKFNKMQVVGDYFIALGARPYPYPATNYDFGGAAPGYFQNSFSYSKDGVYWATQKLPYGIHMLRNIAQEGRELLFSFDSHEIFKFKLSDLEKNLPQSGVYVQVGEEVLGFSAPPVIEDDRTLVPMRFLFEKLGARVDWQAATNTAVVRRGADVIAFSIGDTEALVNGAAKSMDVPARLVNDKTMVPLRFLSEELGYSVDWDEAAGFARIRK